MAKQLKSFEEIKAELANEIKVLKEELEDAKLQYSEALNEERRYLKRVNGLMIEEFEIRQRIEQLKKQEVPVVVKPPEPPKIVEYITKEQLDYLHVTLDEYPKLATALLSTLEVPTLSKIPKADYHRVMTDIRTKQKGLDKCPKSEW